MSKTYVAGPMTGLPDLNFPAFHARAAELRALGHEVINPAEINPDKSMSWRECMRTDIAALVFCDAIDLLPGWQASDGATLEHHIADRLGLKVNFAPGATPDLPMYRKAVFDNLLGAIRLTLAENAHLADGDDCTLKRLVEVLKMVGAAS